MGRLRTWGMPLGVVAVLAVSWASGLTEGVTPESIGLWLEAAGPWGVLGFVALFVVANLVGIPGVVFVLAALFAYGPVLGGGVAMLGGVTSAVVNVTVLRWIGGGPVEGGPAWITRVMGWAETRPVHATALLRALTVVAPPANVALALSPVRCRDHALGSALGLTVPVTFYAVGYGCLAAAL